MLTKLTDWIIGREPVATATGIAGVVTAILGVAAAFGADITAEQIAAIGTLGMALAGWLSRKAVSPVESPTMRQYSRLRQKVADEVQQDTFDTVADDSRMVDVDPGVDHYEGERGSVLVVIGVVILLFVSLFVVCDALIADEDEINDLGAPTLVMPPEA